MSSIKKLHEELTEKLLRQIQSGEYMPGDRLPAERVLASQYGVSRSVVREALSSLNQMGCITSKAGGGNYIKTPESTNILHPLSIMFSQNDDFALEMVEARLIVETEVARLAATRRSEQQLAAMWKTIEQMRSAVSKGGDGVKLDRKFHEQLTQAADNRALALIVLSYSEILYSYMTLTQSLEGVPNRIIAAHENILRAVERQDPAAAEKAMRDHLIDSHENLKKALNQK